MDDKRLGGLVKELQSGLITFAKRELAKRKLSVDDAEKYVNDAFVKVGKRLDEEKNPKSYLKQQIRWRVGDKLRSRNLERKACVEQKRLLLAEESRNLEKKQKEESLQKIVNEFLGQYSNIRNNLSLSHLSKHTHKNQKFNIYSVWLIELRRRLCLTLMDLFFQDPERVKREIRNRKSKLRDVYRIFIATQFPWRPKQEGQLKLCHKPNDWPTNTKLWESIFLERASWLEARKELTFGEMYQAWESELPKDYVTSQGGWHRVVKDMKKKVFSVLDEADYGDFFLLLMWRESHKKGKES